MQLLKCWSVNAKYSPQLCQLSNILWNSCTLIRLTKHSHKLIMQLSTCCSAGLAGTLEKREGMSEGIESHIWTCPSQDDSSLLQLCNL